MGEPDGERVKVCFALERESDDWPPVGIEGVWARPCGDGEYELDNIPWFARDVACGDRVRAEPGARGELYVSERVAWSGSYTIRVVPFGDGPAVGQLQEIIDEFTHLGAECEGGLPTFKIVALDIPPAARLAEIKALLRRGARDGRWDYEEACIDDRWAAL